ncbi:serum response factor-like [Diadema antillarum]|uniref:serum response factor-like n=1 Tax=Diadema antillarum TaxID=105358 RepID=UPI003A8BD534
MTTISFSPLQKLKNGSGDHGACLADSDSSSVGTGSELAERDHDLDEPGLGPGLTHLTPADLEKAAGKHKKTKGRVKIKMEFIDNKLRRYTTFSKRKTGIMKKAYELSTLTGTQVMLLVASETGHVYTFATRKLQPMITSESGKALIQTCLNSPDIPSDNHHHNPDQRMSATGFEETELSYQVSDEEALNAKEGKAALFTATNIPGAGADANINTSASTSLQLTGAGHTFPMTTYLPTSSAAQIANAAKVNSSLAGSVSTAVPQVASFTTLISPTGQALTPGQALQTTGVLQVQPQGQPQVQIQANAQSHTPAAAPTLYRLPQGASLTGPASQVVTALVPSIPAASTATTTQPSQNANSVAMLAAPQTSISHAGSTNAIAAPLMYHAPQGLVYAASPGSDGFVFNYQAATAHLAQVSQANVEGSSSSAFTGTVPAIPIQVHVACQQGTTTTQASNSAIAAALPLSTPPQVSGQIAGAALRTASPAAVQVKAPAQSKAL